MIVNKEWLPAVDFKINNAFDNIAHSQQNAHWQQLPVFPLSYKVNYK